MSAVDCVFSPDRPDDHPRAPARSRRILATIGGEGSESSDEALEGSTRRVVEAGEAIVARHLGDMRVLRVVLLQWLFADYLLHRRMILGSMAQSAGARGCFGGRSTVATCSQDRLPVQAIRTVALPGCASDFGTDRLDRFVSPAMSFIRRELRIADRLGIASVAILDRLVDRLADRFTSPLPILGGSTPRRMP